MSRIKRALFIMLIITLFSVLVLVSCNKEELPNNGDNTSGENSGTEGGASSGDSTGDNTGEGAGDGSGGSASGGTEGGNSGTTDNGSTGGNNSSGDTGGENSSGSGTVNNKPSEGLEFTLSSDGTYYEGSGIGTCKDTDLVIPSEYNSKPVKAIGERAFYDCEGLKSITIGNGVTSIGESAFYCCTGLTSVTIPDSVTSIGEDAFYICNKLVEVINKSSLNITKGSEDYGYIAYYALEVHQGESKTVNKNGYLFYTYDGINYLLGYTGNDTVLTLPESYNGESYKIHNYAFYGNENITSITVPSSVTSIGYEAFNYCYKLVEVINKSSLNITKGSWGECGNIAYYALEVHQGESKIVNKNGYLFYTYDGINYLLGYTGNDTALTLPESYNGESYEIYACAFYKNKDIISITVPNSVTSIGMAAFYRCTGLKTINYRGTETQWNAVSKGYGWDSGTGSTVYYNYKGN